jgi:hypothetical protein
MHATATAVLHTPRSQTALAASPQPELRRLLVTVTDDSVLIAGTVSCYYLKQLAQETVKPTADGRRVVNRVEVNAN